MGMLELIEGADGRFTVSMIKWGFLRRLLVSGIYTVSKPNRFEQPSFVPAFELAVFSRSPLRRPVVLIHFADDAAAKRGWEAITSAIRERGLKGATDYVCNIPLSEMREFGQIYATAL